MPPAEKLHGLAHLSTFAKSKPPSRCENVQRSQQHENEGMDRVRPWNQSDGTGEEAKWFRRAGGTLWRSRPWMEHEALQRSNHRAPPLHTVAFKQEQRALHLLALFKFRLQ
mmetsp:Transcript_2221/g.14744  ORF Transcript_2221/g.14744 Transcript_2221/m.14744 type:complete len:111 (-) Transcript_2221:978-1310(-)